MHGSESFSSKIEALPGSAHPLLTAERPTGQVSDQVSERPTDPVTGPVSEQPTDPVSDRVSDQVADKPVPILIVDDSEADFILIREYLSEVVGTRFEATWCDNFDDGLAAALSGGYRVATVDYRLGIRDGIELIEAAVGRGCGIPMILLTGAGGVELDRRAMVTGAADFLDKGSLSALLLGRCIQHALQRYALEAQRNRYADTLQAIMDHSPFGVWVTDTDGRFRFANKTLERQVGSTEGVARRAVGDLFGDEARKEFSTEGGRRLEKDGPNQVVYASVPVAGKGVRDFKVTRVNIRDRTRGVTGFLGISEDVTETWRLQAAVTYQATHDALTGLFNRTVFEKKVKQVCQAIGPDDAPFTLLFFDLDRFKVINDTWGHQAGDEVLKALVSRYTEQLRKTERFVTLEGDRMEPPLARLGGDEFGVLLSNCPAADGLRVARRLIAATEEFSLSFCGHRLSVGCSVGLVEITSDNEGWSQVVMQADNACYVAKESGKGRAHLYQPGDVAIRGRREALAWGQKITQGLKDGRLELFYQPLVPISGEEDGDRFEILLRYRDGGVSQPAAKFLPAAERLSLMPAVDRWVISQAFADLERIYGAGAQGGSRRTLLSAAINLSGQTLGEGWLLPHILQCLEETSIRPEQICLEITETAAIANLERAKQLIDTLKVIGVRFALDDFGSGLSSFAYLRQLDVDYLKLDGTFVQDIVHDPVAREMVVAIHRVGRIMNLKVVAEWVEDARTLRLLRDMGVDYAQGYLVGQPAPLVASLTA